MNLCQIFALEKPSRKGVQIFRHWPNRPTYLTGWQIHDGINTASEISEGAEIRPMSKVKNFSSLGLPLVEEVLMGSD